MSKTRIDGGRSATPHMPAAALIDLTACSPFCQALRLAPAADDGAIALLLKADASLSDAKDPTMLHVAAIAGVLDNALAVGANAMIPEGSRPATIDLRWEMFRAPPLVDVVVSATSAIVTREAVFVHGEMAEAQTGAVFGRANASVGYSAPNAGIAALVKADPSPAVRAANFERWLELEGQGPVYVAPYHVRLRGASTLPFWHGGALMAAMTAAAVKHIEALKPHAQLTSATANFDVFATDLPLEIDCSEFRVTRTRAVVHARAAQAGRGVTSRLTAHFTLAED